MSDFYDLFMPSHRQARQPHAESEWPADDRVDLAALIDMLHPAWHHRAACRGKTDVMYGDGGLAVSARQLCFDCPVRTECAEAAIKEPFGVWGGLSARQRQRIRTQRRKAA